MNIKKILGTLLAGFLALPLIAGAAYNDVSLNGDVVLNVNSLNVGVSSDGTTLIESMTVNASDFTVTLQQDSAFYATSSARATFGAEIPSPLSQSKPCTSSESGLSLSSVSASMTVTVTPSSTLCDATPSSSSSSGSSGGGIIVGLIGGSGGGGGGGSTAVAVASTPTVPAIVASTPAVSQMFNYSLSVGAETPDVTRLQTFLAADPAVYPEGRVTGYFGGLTQKAVGKFQEKYGIANPGDAGYGNFGPKTRTKLNELIGAVGAIPAVPATPAVPQVTPATPATPAVPSSGSFAKGLKVGQSDSDIKVLQEVLNRDPDTMVAESGAGSSGNETNYFGSLTQKAVGKFQEKYGIAIPTDDAYGYVGPMTRAKLNELLAP